MHLADFFFFPTSPMSFDMIEINKILLMYRVYLSKSINVVKYCNLKYVKEEEGRKHFSMDVNISICLFNGCS